MIDPSDKKLSIRKQAKLLGINRNRLAARPDENQRRRPQNHGHHG